MQGIKLDIHNYNISDRKYKTAMPSSVVAHIKYNAEEQSLYITYVSGLVYKYKNVPVNIYNAMKAATSKGSYLNKHIKPKYAYEKI